MKASAYYDSLLAWEIVDLERKRKRLTKRLDTIESQQRELKEQLCKKLLAADEPRVLVGKAECFLEKKPTATITDFKSVLRWALDHNELQVVHQRVSPTQIEALAFQDRLVDGVTLDHKWEVRVKLPKPTTSKKEAR